MIRSILVATHGTAGAVRAEAYACFLARALDAALHGLYVIHSGWASLVGIEWLHSSRVRMDFYRYAESEFHRRAEEVLAHLRSVAGDRDFTTAVRVGDPAEVITDEARVRAADLIVIGGRSPVRSEEYRARLSVKKLLKQAPCPVLVATALSAALAEGGGADRIATGMIS